MASRVALVQGASRGIGLEFVRQLLQRPEVKVIGTCRSNPDTVPAFSDLQRQYPSSFIPVQLDCTEESSVQILAFQKALEVVKSEVTYLNLLLNAAGILHNDQGLFPEKTFKTLNSENMMVSYKVNAMGPALVMKHFSELLINSEKHGLASEEHPAVIANMSARFPVQFLSFGKKCTPRVSSISDNSLGGWYSYRASKTALNQLTKCFSLELARKKQKVACILLHPGTVETDLSKPFQRNVPPKKLFSKEFAVTQLLQVIDKTTMVNNGKLFAWDGSEVGW